VHDGGDVDDAVALHHAQFVVVEEGKLHVGVSPVRCSISR
jgi:hypothetical protein